MFDEIPVNEFVRWKTKIASNQQNPVENFSFAVASCFDNIFRNDDLNRICAIFDDSNVDFLIHAELSRNEFFLRASPLWTNGFSEILFSFTKTKYLEGFDVIPNLAFELVVFWLLNEISTNLTEIVVVSRGNRRNALRFQIILSGAANPFCFFLHIFHPLKIFSERLFLLNKLILTLFSAKVKSSKYVIIKRNDGEKRWRDWLR